MEKENKKWTEIDEGVDNLFHLSREYLVSMYLLHDFEKG